MIYDQVHHRSQTTTVGKLRSKKVDELSPYKSFILTRMQRSTGKGPLICLFERSLRSRPSGSLPFERGKKMGLPYHTVICIISSRSLLLDMLVDNSKQKNEEKAHDRFHQSARGFDLNTLTRPSLFFCGKTVLLCVHSKFFLKKKTGWKKSLFGC